MGGDDLQLGKVGGHVVEEDGAAVAELDAAPARQAGAQARGPGVEQGGHPELRARGVEVVEAMVVGRELLTAGVQLQPPEAELGDRPPQLGHRRLSLPGVDRGEAHEGVGVFLDAPGHVVVGERRQSHAGLRVPGQQDAQHVLGAELLGHVVDAADGHLGAEVADGGFPEGAERLLDPLVGGEMDVKIDRLHGAGSSGTQWWQRW